MQKVLKIWSLLVFLLVLVAFKITKIDISCIITCDSGPYWSNFITCIRIYNAKEKKNRDHAKYYSVQYSMERKSTKRRLNHP